jgi:hypothetical protein
MGGDPLKNHDPHEVWKKYKKAAVDMAAKDGHKADTEALEKQFDQGLGKALDKFLAESYRPPEKLDLAKLKTLRNGIAPIIKGYKDKALKAQPKIGRAAKLLADALDAVDKSLGFHLQTAEQVKKNAALEKKRP